MSPLSRLLAPLLLSVPASAQVLHVDAALNTGANDGSTWADAYQGSDGLRQALSASSAGDQIFATEGIYLPTAAGSRSLSFGLKSGVEVYGGFIGNESSPDERPPFGAVLSVLSGDLNGDDGSSLFNDNSYHVVNGAGTNLTAVLDGFIVSGGNANGAGNNNRGAGILCTGGASPSVQTCLFVDNRCTFGGGAGYINGSAPRFTDCRFEDNIGGAFGGAFDIATAGSVRFDRCWFEGNRAARAGALEIFATSGVIVTNSVFRANTSTGSGGGGGIWMGSGGNTQFRCCTVVANVSNVNQAGGMLVQGAVPSVANCVFWDNAGPGGAQGSANQITGTSNVSYSIVEGGFAGTGNLGTDPMFQDVVGGDYMLTGASPAIDAGNNASVPAGILLDHAQDPRFVDEPSVPDTGAGSAPIVDMGAFEYQGTPLVAFCFGDGSGTACPCMNDGTFGNGCANSAFAGGANLTSSGAPSVSSDSLLLLASQSTPLQPGIFFQGDNALAGGLGIPFGDGLRCVGSDVCRIEVITADASGQASSTLPIAATCGVSAGELKRYQWWYRDPSGSPCGAGFNLSNGVEATWAP